MATPATCPECGAPLPAGAAAGVCAKCQSRDGSAASSGSQVPSEDAVTVGLSPDRGTAALPFSYLSYFGDYELLGEIARGGMGVVIKARQVSLDRILAVKMILAGQLARPEDVERFRAEAEAAANLSHPNIVAVHEVGEHQGQHYFSMDFVEGKSLAEIVREGPMTARTAASYVKQMAEAIQYAHQRGTLHRDIKPSNVLIDADGRVRITDFGLAKRLDRGSDLTVSGAVMGTPAYMSPEQAAGRRGEVGVASDVYSLGAVLYELLTGRAPYRAETPFGTVLQIRESEPVPPRSLNPTIPADLATICLKCMERHPLRRYATAGALAEDLDRFLNQQPILARPASSVRKLWGVSKRRPWLFTALVATVGMLLLGIAYWLWAENALLRYKAEHPEYAREPGALAEEAKLLVKCAGLAGTLGMSSLLFFTRWFRRQRRRQLPVPTAILVAYGAVGVGILLFVLYTCARSIDAAVWEGHQWRGGRFWWVEYLTVYMPYLACVGAAWLGLAMVAQALREYEFSAFGTSDEPALPPEQVETARSLILDKKFAEALKYCLQVSSSKSAGIETYLTLKDALVAEYPDRLPELTFLGQLKRAALIVLLVMGGLFAVIYVFTRIL